MAQFYKRYEGSITFTRSIDNQRLTQIRRPRGSESGNESENNGLIAWFVISRNGFIYNGFRNRRNGLRVRMTDCLDAGSRARGSILCRGYMDQKQISVWWLKRQRLCAALIMNRPEEERTVAPGWICGSHG